MLDIDCSSKAMGPLGRYDGLALILVGIRCDRRLGRMRAVALDQLSQHGSAFAEYGIKDAATVQALGRVLENPQPFNVKREVQRWTII